MSVFGFCEVGDPCEEEREGGKTQRKMTPPVVVRTLYRHVLRAARRYASHVESRSLPLEHEVALLGMSLSRPVFVPDDVPSLHHRGSEAADAVLRIARSAFRNAAGAGDEAVSARLVPDAFASLRWLGTRADVFDALPRSTRSERRSGPCRVAVTARAAGRDRSSVHRFAYDVEIVNESDDVTFQLVSRRWEILDSLAAGAADTVEGAGVVGKHPTLRPGDRFAYGSWTPLKSPLGCMRGAFRMVLPDGGSFEAEVAPFLLAAGEYVPPAERQGAAEAAPAAPAGGPEEDDK